MSPRAAAYHRLRRLGFPRNAAVRLAAADFDCKQFVWVDPSMLRPVGRVE